MILAAILFLISLVTSANFNIQLTTFQPVFEIILQKMIDACFWIDDDIGDGNNYGGCGSDDECVGGDAG